MKKTAVVYWSGSGNTEAMAEAVAKAIRSAGSVAEVMTPDAFSAAKVASYDAIAFGCPAMGSEELESSEFEPMFADCESALSGKTIALFGSYGWGGGEWMRTWEARCIGDGAVLACDSVICCDAPDSDAFASLEELGKALA